MYSGPWLIDRIEEAAALERSDDLMVSIVPVMSPSASLPWPHHLLRAQISERLKLPLDRVSINSTLFFDEVPVPPRFLPMPPPEQDADAWDHRRFGVMIPGGLIVGLPRPDGTWLRLETHGPNDKPERSIRLLVWLALVGAAIAIPSIWTANRLVAPLAGLASAAERFGIDRSAPAIPVVGPTELRTIAQAFNSMGARLKRFVDDRTQMIAAISHDLRTPITRMRLRAEFIVDPDQRARMLRDLAEMEQMVAATLAFAGADAHHEERVLVDIAALVADLCDDLAEDGQDVGYVGPYHASLFCQPLAVRRVVTNLVENALRHGAAPVKVSVAEEADAILIDVVDRGPGINPANHERVMQPFVRLETSRNRETGGVGLGLTIARTVVHAHGGSITLINLQPRGLQVRLMLPKAVRGAATHS